MGPPLQFISAHTKGKLDDLKVRRTVRQNAMRAFRRSQRLQMVKEFQEKKARVQDASQELFTSFQTTTEAVANTSPTTPKIQNTNLENYHNNTEDGLSLEIGPRFAFDPFSSTWLCSHHSAPELFSHFIHHVAPSIQPFGSHLSHNPINSTLVQQALSDPALLGALLFHSAVHLDHIHNRPWRPVTVYHRGQTIRLLRQRLESIQKATSDNFMAAVSLLGASGNITGNVHDDLLHREAMQRIVKMRGGLQGLGWNGALAMLMSIGDVISASISASKPMLECPILTTSTPDLEALDKLQSLEVPSNMAQDLPSFHFQIHALITHIAALASIHSTSFVKLTATITTMITFNQHCLAIEHRLLSIRLPDPYHSSQDPELLVLEAARIAALMCLTYLFRHMKPEALIFTSLRARLQGSLKSFDEIESPVVDQATLRLLLWATCVGAITSVGPLCFADGLQRCMSRLDIGSWDELNLCLRGYVWTEVMRRFMKGLSQMSSLWRRPCT